MAKTRILIIDDDPDIIESMQIVLESRGYQVNSYNSGEEGLKNIDSVRPDLIILDVMMENNSAGFDVARELRSRKNYEKTPILMLTAMKEKTGWDFRKEAGDESWLPVNDYCDKPLDPSVLLEKVSGLLARVPKA